MDLSVRPDNYKQIDNVLSRSAQPNRENYIWLQKNGITDVISFRTRFHRDKHFNEEKIAKEFKIKYHNIPSISRAPSNENVGKFLDIVENVKLKNGKVLMHCKQGADRTGMYAFIYETLNSIGTEGSRIIELFQHGYHYKLYPNLIDQALGFIKLFKR